MWIRNLVLFAFLLSYSVFAFANINCPPTYVIINTGFVKADGAMGIWDLFADEFIYANRSWQLIFTVYLPDASNDKDALQKGEDFFRSEVTFFDQPMGSVNNNKQTCYYAQQESSYFVRAISIQ